MRAFPFRVVAPVVALAWLAVLALSDAQGQSVALASATKSLCDDGSCDAPGCARCDLGCGGGLLASDRCGWFLGAEATFFQYHRADGVRFGTAGPGEVADFDYEISPRITLGHIGGPLGGFRARWWDYDHFAPGRNVGEGIGVETVVWDFEWFDTVFANRCWTIEMSAGLRYNEFTETMIDSGAEFRINDFDGFGGVFGMEVQRAFRYGTLYARGKYAVLTGDKFVRNDDSGGGSVTLNDTVLSVGELGIGYQYSRCLRNGSLLVARFGGEWQQWYNYSSQFDSPFPAGEAFGGPSDVGFVGLTSMVGIYY